MISSLLTLQYYLFICKAHAGEMPDQLTRKMSHLLDHFEDACGFVLGRIHAVVAEGLRVNTPGGSFHSKFSSLQTKTLEQTYLVI